MTTIDRPAAPPAAGPPPPQLPITADEAVQRISEMALASFEFFSIYIGDRLGWYRSLADEGPATPAELADRTGTNERYTREWLEQQAVAALLAFDPASGRYAVTPGMAEATTDEHSLNYVGPLPHFLAAVGPFSERLLEVYRHGGGVSWGELGSLAAVGQARLNRPWFEHKLADALRTVPALDRVLSRPGARILDIGAGGGWSTIALAEAYPQARITGLDIDEPSVAMARKNAAGSAAADRISFVVGDAGRLEPGSFDAAFAFEMVHDLPYPVAVLNALRRATTPAGPVVIMDEAVADEFTVPGNPVDRFMYGASLFICLPDGLSSPNSAGTGTVMRRPTLERYAAEAGFSSVEVLPIDDFAFFRFYRLHH